ncbi:FRG domain-containing protein [Rhizobium ruizarguesonis]
MARSTATWAEFRNPRKAVRVRRRGETVETVAEFIESITDNKGLPWHQVVYRGQKDIRWFTQASIFRNSEKLLRYEHEMGRELMSVHPGDFAGDMTMFDRLVRMQHYGIPTRLVDVSRNPLVALYFACEEHSEPAADDDLLGRIGPTAIDGAVIAYHVPSDRSKFFDSDTVAVLANLANLRDVEKKEIADSFFASKGEFNELDSVQRLASFVQAEKPYFKANIDPLTPFVPMYVKPRLSNKRVIAQSGAFLIYGLDIADSKSEHEHNIRQRHIRVPAAKKQSIREDLDRLGINESTLFPELNKAADQIVRRYTRQYDHDSVLDI